MPKSNRDLNPGGQKRRYRLAPDTPGFAMLKHLAAEGATEVDACRDKGEELLGKEDRAAASALLRHLADKGLIRTKVWLTPEGLDELRAGGWTPELAGVVEAEAQPS